MDTKVLLPSYNLNKTESSLSLDYNDEEVDYLDETAGNREVLHFHFFRGRSAKVVEITSSKIILGAMILAGVGILGGIIAIVTTLPSRSISIPNNRTQVNSSHSFIIPQLRVLPLSTTATSTFTNAVMQSITQATPQLTTRSITQSTKLSSQQLTTQSTTNSTIQTIAPIITQLTKQASPQLTTSYTTASTIQQSKIPSSINKSTIQSASKLTTNSTIQTIAPSITPLTKQVSSQLTTSYTTASTIQQSKVPSSINKSTIQSASKSTTNSTIKSIAPTIITQSTKQSIIEPTKQQCQQSQFLPSFISQTANNLTSQVNKQNLQNALKKLLTFGPRDNIYDSKSDAYKEAVVNISRTLNNMEIPTHRQDFDYGTPYRDLRNCDTPPCLYFREIEVILNEDCRPTMESSCNLCTLIPGKTNRIIAVGAHLDTVENSPGANDNGSGVVALLEVIRIFKESNLKLNNPILFCFWGSKELSPKNKTGVAFGSEVFLSYKYEATIKDLAKHYSCSAKMDDAEIQCYLNIELAGTKNRNNTADISIEDPTYNNPNEPMYGAWGSAPPGTQNLTELYAEFLTSRKINFLRASPTPSKSDVQSFYRKDIPALTIKATADNSPSCDQQPCDNLNNVNFDVLTNITQTVVYALTKLSLGEGLDIY